MAMRTGDVGEFEWVSVVWVVYNSSLCAFGFSPLNIRLDA